jgi:pSer/pThr/pTyr-binding forkhead associated (FHA) protein
VIGGAPIPMLPLTPENARLRVKNGPAAGKVFLLDKMRLLVGRSNPPAIVVDVDLGPCELASPPMVSRRHAELQWINSQLNVVDLGSANGTFIDGNRLSGNAPKTPSEPAVLQAGSMLRLGNLELEVIRDER